ncbi:MAG: ATP-binding cassette domain-containing protein [Myxococcota bacterium]
MPAAYRRMIEVEDLHKSYGSVHAVRGITFAVTKGSVCGFLGPNGAGKSTTLRILAGFLGASSGRVQVAGYDIVRQRLEAVQNIGYMPEMSPLYPELRVGEYLTFRAELKGVERRARKREVDRVLELAAVRDMVRMRVGALSKGYRQRVGLADALLGSPPLLILDEPTAGLDPNQVQQVRSLLHELRDRHTILISTHILSEVEATCDGAIVIDRGRVVAEGSLGELRQARRPGEYELHIRPGSTEVNPILRSVEGVRTGLARDESSADGASRFLLQLEPNLDVVVQGRIVEEVVTRLVGGGVGVRHVAPVAASLEDVFASLTAGERAKTPEE